MNTVKNKHFEGTHKLIMDTFRTLVISKHNKISVKDICDVSGINRSTFYAHFEDIDTLMDGVFFVVADNVSSRSVRLAL